MCKAHVVPHRDTHLPPPPPSRASAHGATPSSSGLDSFLEICLKKSQKMCMSPLFLTGTRRLSLHHCLPPPCMCMQCTQVPKSSARRRHFLHATWRHFFLTQAHVRLGMAIRVWVSGTCRVLDPMGTGTSLIFYPWVRPKPRRVRVRIFFPTRG
jgi:hypothetical protein